MRSAPRPLYYRVLRVRHLRPGWLVTLALFEGSCLLGVILSLADVVTPWAVVLLPTTVAIMVKFNDVIAGALIRPLAVAQLNTPRALQQAAVGRSPVPRPSRLTAQFSTDDARLDPEATPGGDVARGVASVPGALPAMVRRPRPGLRPSPRPPRGEDTAAMTDVDQPARSDGADGRSRGNQGRFEA